MIIEKSDINYIHFGVIEVDFKCTMPKEDKAISIDMDVDLNYDIFKIDDNKNIFQIVLDLKLTPPAGLAGYTINLKPIGVFELPANIDKKQIDSALIYTCIPMILGNARGFILEITSHFPFGKYFLPSLSMNRILAANNNKSDGPQI